MKSLIIFNLIFINGNLSVVVGIQKEKMLLFPYDYSKVGTYHIDMSIITSRYPHVTSQLHMVLK